jgi:hypothetical protein
MSENFVSNKSHQHLGGANPDLSGNTYTAAGKAQPNQRGFGTTGPVASTPFQPDESVLAFIGPESAPSTCRDNFLPPVPPIERGNR